MDSLYKNVTIKALKKEYFLSGGEEQAKNNVSWEELGKDFSCKYRI